MKANLVLIGMPGSGKTTIAREIAARTALVFVDLDEEIVRAAGKSIPQIFADSGEAAFRELETRCAQETARHAGQVIAAGGGIVLRAENMRRLAESATIVFLDRSVTDICAGDLSGRPLIGGNLARVQELYEKRIGLYRRYAEKTVASLGSPAEVAGEVLRAVGRDAKKLRLAVIGDPIGHTLSPFIQTKMMEHLGVAGDYRAQHVRPEELGAFVRDARTELDGFNLTIPHKSRVLPFLDEMDTYAARCGAVNTVRVRAGKLCGFNTDGDGIQAALRLMGVGFSGARVSLLGAGGAAHSICRKALETGAKTVTVFCRHPEKAGALADDPRVRLVDFSTLSAENCGKVSDVILNATPLGMSGFSGDFADFSFLDGARAVCDIVYKPAETSLLRACKKRGICAANGLPMLLYQAVYAFEIFSGLTFDRDEMAEYLLQELREKNAF